MDSGVEFLKMPVSFVVMFTTVGEKKTWTQMIACLPEIACNLICKRMTSWNVNFNRIANIKKKRPEGIEDELVTGSGVHSGFVWAMESVDSFLPVEARKVTWLEACSPSVLMTNWPALQEKQSSPRHSALSCCLKWGVSHFLGSDGPVLAWAFGAMAPENVRWTCPLDHQLLFGKHWATW